MRPVVRGPAPLRPFARYGDAYPALVARLEKYCSYCERYLPTGLAVEHIQPKSRDVYRHLELVWDNFLLGCVNCNSTKGDQDVLLHDLLLPDRDNTLVAYVYSPDGTVAASGSLDARLRALAERTLDLTGQNAALRRSPDPNERRVALDRINQRREVWAMAEVSRAELIAAPSEPLRQAVVRLASVSGFFSIWIKVFEGDADMRRRIVAAFPGTAADCFDARMRPRSPRPSTGLPHCSKI